MKAGWIPLANCRSKILFQRKLEELKAPVIYVEGEEKGFSFGVLN